MTSRVRYERFFGAAAPLSAATITRTNEQLFLGLATWSTRRLDDLDMIFMSADGVYLGAGPDDERRVFLVVVGAGRTGQQAFARVARGHERE